MASLAFAAGAGAAPPALLSAGEQDRHPTATFSLPGADDAMIYFATKPDRATDGSFLQENVEDLDLFTADEIQAGQWLYESQLDPGGYYVMLRATDYDCLGDPGCMGGFSDVLSLTIPKPASRYRGQVRTYRYLSAVTLGFRADPLGERLPYRVCWRLVGRRKCVRGALDGYSWSSPATDEITVRRPQHAPSHTVRLVRGRPQGCVQARPDPAPSQLAHAGQLIARGPQLLFAGGRGGMPPDKHPQQCCASLRLPASGPPHQAQALTFRPSTGWR